ncbi:MAG TPA: PVC-type heme-binding CxxCH protein [Tepidisphaeraceae bacterium]|nr:PVC-type heme-binding CxxCH protein [Tepidisphaeraceae bacterium]
MKLLVTISLLAAVSSSFALGGDDPFAKDVRATEPLAPAEQAKTFTLPPGFTITLVAAEPDVNKPMNLAFDARGRLWVTSTSLYPWPAKTEADKTDAIKVIELNDDGSARNVTIFAAGLDIPIGILPLGDGRRALAYDIASIRLFTDTDGDGSADRRDVLYSGFDHTRDTHGMASNFRRGFDGWVYACHGFNNVSNVKDQSGNVVHLRSGNTFRMRPDGSRVEAFTIGQINPFGLCFDPLGNLYTSDSHSKPIYQLLRGGRYEAFDRDTNDGLGLAPAMMQHLHNSTAIAGSQFYAANAFPQEFRGNVFVGNVVTSRINRDKLEYFGSTPKAIEQPDFLTTTDPWFRPVQTVLGPDGALYVADFYNRIIGHYEVDLKHPGRDFQRGRIWRIAYTGKGDAPVSRYDFSAAGAPQLIEKLGDANLTVRMLATNELSDRIGADAIGPCLLATARGSTLQKIHALWVLHRLKAMELGTLATAAADKDAAVRVHTMRILSETHPWGDAQHMLALEGLKDPDPLVQRCAADALGTHPHVTHIHPLLELRHGVAAADTHLLYVVRMALRNQLAAPGAIDAVLAGDASLSPADRLAMMDVAQAVPTPDAAAFLLEHLEEVARDKESMARMLRHGVRYADARAIPALVAVLRKRFGEDVDLQLELFAAVQKAAAERGEPLAQAAREWGANLARSALALSNDEQTVWSALPLPGMAAGTAADSPSPWTLQQRVSSDGDTNAVFFSSLPLGERLTGVLRSRPFVVPAKLSMYIAGHNGPPRGPDLRKQVIRLRSAQDDAILVESVPPRHDTAQPLVWDLKDHAGKQAYIEATDGDDGSGYAWLAFGRLDPPVAPLPSAAPAMVAARQRQAAEIAAALSLKDLAGPLREIVKRRDADVAARTAAAAALASVDAQTFVPLAEELLADAGETMAVRESVAESLSRMTTDGARAALLSGFRTAPARLQTALASALATTPDGAAALLNAIENSAAPATLLQDSKLVERLSAANVPQLDQRVGRLTRGLPTPQDSVIKLIEQRRDSFTSAPPDPGAGAAVFAKNCAQCHQLGGQGKLVGPQLDGIGNRGVERLIEDILDPNRNVDPAFRYSNVTLKDTTLITGLQKREEGETLVFVDTTGKEVTVSKAQIKSRAESRLSIMPSNFGEIIPPEQFNQLLAFLMASKPPTAPIPPQRIDGISQTPSHTPPE